MTRAAVGFGGNVGRPDLAFGRALARLRREARVVRVSRLYRSAPWGRVDQPAFLNGAVLLETSSSPRSLLALLRAEERSAGRVRGAKWGPRTLDLDLLWYGDRVSSELGLVLPHPALAERSFVLEPLAEIAPRWRHPVTGASAAGMLGTLRREGRATACERLPFELGTALAETTCRS